MLKNSEEKIAYSIKEYVEPSWRYNKLILGEKDLKNIDAKYNFGQTCSACVTGQT